MAELAQFGFTPISLDISAIRCDCFVKWIAKRRKLIGLIAFNGKYALGSAGSNDARFIRWRIDEFCTVVTDHGTIDSLLVDLRLLNYEWGDDLSVHPRKLSMPFLVICNSEQVTPLSGAIGSDELRTNLEDSIRKLIET